MGWIDLMAAIEGYNDGVQHGLNMLRHNMWASLAAFQGKDAPSPHKLLPLPMDKQTEDKPMTKEEFLLLAARLRQMDKMAKA